MRKAAYAVSLVLALCASVSAHHSYGAFDREHPVSIEGTVERVRFANPHVVLTLRSADARTYTITWRAAYQLSQMGVSANTFEIGERLLVSGSPARDATIHEITLIRQVQRLRDGWTWRMADGRQSVTGGSGS